MKRKREKTHQAEADGTLRLMLAYLCASTEAEASLERKVEILDRFDMTDREIAKICGCVLQSVRNARRSLKRSAYATNRRRS